MNHQKRVVPQPRSPLVSVIILTFQDIELTLASLAAVLRHSRYPRLEVLVVDNGSPRKHQERLLTEIRRLGDARIRVMLNRRNLGYAVANNLAAGKARGKYLVFLNNDVIVTPAWLTPLVRFLERTPGVAACQPKLRSQVEREYFDYSGGSGGFLDLFGYPFTRGRIFDSIERDFGQYDAPAPITWAAGSCLLVARRAFREIGGFDRYYFAYMEEIDLAVRLARQGYTIWCVPESVVFHYGAYTNNRDLPQKIFMNHRNNLYFVLKHYSLWPNFPIILIRFLLDVFSVLHYLLESKPAYALSLVRAHLSLLGSLPWMVRQRVISLSGRSLLANPTVYRGSVVFDYFLLGKENYDRIVGRGGETPRSYKRYVEVTHLDQRRSPIPPLPTKM